MSSPFDLDESSAYQQWREHKLKRAITSAAELIVKIKDPLALSSTERDALLSRCDRSNMAIYASPVAMDENAVQAIGIQLGLVRLDANWLAGEQGISRITVCHEVGEKQAYIPYTDKAIKWHTDGYYNPPDRKIHGMTLHCAQNAGEGGENRIVDHEIIYILLRDANPDFIRAFYAPDAMTIPARTDEDGVAREAQTGPVFSLNSNDGSRLHMRYTARTRSIQWKQDSTTLAAVAYLEQILSSDIPHIQRLQLEKGMGLVCNNVLHDRSAFTDDTSKPRLLYRARYLDSVSVLN